ncbi:hypothetical protein SUGI_0864340 [Cryptomeria japonica]|nr:hypothetical protein SUGI_0864340 [Cryptomeria japonica]
MAEESWHGKRSDLINKGAEQRKDCEDIWKGKVGSYLEPTIGASFPSIEDLFPGPQLGPHFTLCNSASIYEIIEFL